MFEHKVWWITGASSGIGAALASSIAREGGRLILSGRNKVALDQLAGSLLQDSLVLPFDVSDLSLITEIVDQAQDWAASHGGLYGLINNAGITQRSLAIDTVFEVYQKIITVDLLAPIALTQAVLPAMVRAGQGQLVSVSSVAGIVGAPLRSAYSAAKHGLIGYSDSVRAETDHHGIRVLVVAPGSVQTDISRNALDHNAKARGTSDAAIESGMAPADAADRIVEALKTGTRELILAEGAEAQSARLRRLDPDALFDRMAELVAAGYAHDMDAAKPE